MRPTSLEQRLLSLYKVAVQQRRWLIADHLLSALEACAPQDAMADDVLCEAYRTIAATAAPSARRPSARYKAKRSQRP